MRSVPRTSRSSSATPCGASPRHIHGLIASFAAKPFADGVGSGAHIHFSLWSPDGSRNLMYAADAGDRLLSDIGRWFVAGVLLHLPALVALTCPSFNSYERLEPRFVGQLHGLLGTRQPRGVGARRVRRSGDARRSRPTWSSRRATRAATHTSRWAASSWPGSTACGGGLEPPEPVLHDPASVPPRRAGPTRYPAAADGSLREALAALQADAVLFPALGDMLGRCIIAVRTSEADALERLSPDEARLAHLRVF